MEADSDMDNHIIKNVLIDGSVRDGPFLKIIENIKFYHDFTNKDELGEGKITSNFHNHSNSKFYLTTTAKE